MCQMSIFRTCLKIFTLLPTSSNHVYISINISLWTVHNSNPWMLQPVLPSLENLQDSHKKLSSFCNSHSTINYIILVKCIEVNLSYWTLKQKMVVVVKKTYINCISSFIHKIKFGNDTKCSFTWKKYKKKKNF